MAERILRLNELIKEEVSKILLRDIEFPSSVLITVVRVDTTEDAKSSKVYVNVLPSGKEDDIVFTILQKSAGFIQAQLIKKLSMRYVPRISFVLDKSGQEVDSLTNIFEALKKEK